MSITHVRLPIAHWICRNLKHVEYDHETTGDVR